MEHDQFESLVAAILTAGAMNPDTRNEPATVAALFVSMRDEIRRSGAIVRFNAAFVPKGARGSSRASLGVAL